MNPLPLADRALLRNQCLVDGHFVGTPSNPVKNPADVAFIANVPRFGAEEATASVDAAKRALCAWAACTAKERSRILRRWFELMTEHRHDLASILTAEQGKPLAEALGEIDYAAAYVEFYAEEAKRVAGEILPSHRSDARILVMRQPVGVVAAITPWNFPAAMITRKVAPALAAGCTVVVKPAPETPLTALALAELAQRAQWRGPRLLVGRRGGGFFAFDLEQQSWGWLFSHIQGVTVPLSTSPFGKGSPPLLLDAHIARRVSCIQTLRIIVISRSDRPLLTRP